MSEEVKDVTDIETTVEETQQMYVQQLEWDVFKSVIERITNVNTLYMYNMPNKAEKYSEDIVGLIQTLDIFLRGDDEWRVSDEKHVPFKYDSENDKILVGNWVIGKPHLILCIPKLNSFFIIPDNEATYKGSPNPTQIIQLSNCLSVMPMILVMNEVPNEEKEGSYNISMSFEMLNQ